MTSVQATTHYLCSTCVAEFKGGYGYFDNRFLRAKIAPTLKTGYHGEEHYCCRCGAGGSTEATYELPPQEVCGMDHEPYIEEDDI